VAADDRKNEERNNDIVCLQSKRDPLSRADRQNSYGLVASKANNPNLAFQQFHQLASTSLRGRWSWASDLCVFAETRTKLV
jgi:hypothetical protein